jgi:hypothetical protein
MQIVENSPVKFPSEEVRNHVANGEVVRSTKSDQLYLKGPSHLTLLSNGDTIPLTNLDRATIWVAVEAKVIID